MIGGSAREKREYRPVDPRRSQRSRAESSAVQSEADTKQSENEKVIDEKVFDEKHFDKKFFKNLEQFHENKRIPEKKSSRQSKATGVKGEITGNHRNFAQDHRPRPLRSGTESALSELPTDPIFIVSGVWERGKTGSQIRSKSGERAKAEEK